MEAHGNLEDRYTKVPSLDATLDWEINATIEYALENPKEGYRQLSYIFNSQYGISYSIRA